MAVNPIFPGLPQATGYVTTGGAAMTKAVMTNGTTAVNVFGTTNGFKGSVVAVRVIAKGVTAGDITVKAGMPLGAADNGGFDAKTICVIAKSTTNGLIVGSAIGTSSSGRFMSTGSLTIVSSSAAEGAQALVELVFVSHTP
jgi:hypothetical protein